MKLPRLYVEPPLRKGFTVELDRDATKYISRVLRRVDGDPLTLFNGDGYNYTAELILSGKTCHAKVTAQTLNPTESPLNLTLVQSLAKGTKLDLVIQKATELGVNQIIPVTSERSVLQIDAARLQKRMEHWQAVAISACTQCQRSTLPVIAQPRLFNDWLGSTSHADTYLLHPRAKDTIGSLTLREKSCTLVVGPEGGFSEKEIEHACGFGAYPIACGPRILRTETAGFTAIAILQSRFGDLM